MAILLFLAKDTNDKNVSVKYFFKCYTCIQESPPVLRVTSYNMCPVTQPFNIDQIVREVSIYIFIPCLSTPQLLTDNSIRIRTDLLARHAKFGAWFRNRRDAISGSEKYRKSIGDSAVLSLLNKVYNSI